MHTGKAALCFAHVKQLSPPPQPPPTNPASPVLASNRRGVICFTGQNGNPRKASNAAGVPGGRLRKENGKL